MTRRTELVQQVLEAQMDIARNVQAEASPSWSHLDLTMAQLKAVFVVAQDGPLTVSAIAEALGTGRPAASNVIDRLVQLVLVTRTEDATDRRRTNVQLTDAGSELVERLQRSGRAALAGWLDMLDETDLAALAQGMTALAIATKRQVRAASGAVTESETKERGTY